MLNVECYKKRERDLFSLRRDSVMVYIFLEEKRGGGGNEENGRG